MSKILFLLALVASCFCFSQTKKICITVDDLPTVTYGVDSLDQAITSGLLTTFKKYNIPAIGFVVESQLYKNGKLQEGKVDLLKQWINAGMDLGNHTYSHPDYNYTSTLDYFENIKMGERVTKKLLEDEGGKLSYFRHPYLHAGTTKEKADSLDGFLMDHGYKVAPVTIDNDDYLFAKAYHEALLSKNDSLMKRIGEAYIKYQKDKLKYFEGKGVELSGSYLTQTMLIHASLINAHYFGDLAEMYLANGYTFVSMDEAMTDPTYSTPISVYQKRGLSWVFRWAFSTGKDASFMDGDVETPQIVSQ